MGERNRHDDNLSLLSPYPSMGRLISPGGIGLLLPPMNA
jgi:hypothetical protein